MDYTDYIFRYLYILNDIAPINHRGKKEIILFWCYYVSDIDLYLELKIDILMYVIVTSSSKEKKIYW